MKFEHGAGSGKSRDRVIDAGTLGLIRVEAVVRADRPRPGNRGVRACDGKGFDYLDVSFAANAGAAVSSKIAGARHRQPDPQSLRITAKTASYFCSRSRPGLELGRLVWPRSRCTETCVMSSHNGLA